MQNRLFIALAGILLLPGCVGVVAYGQTREAGRPVIEKVMSETRPNLDSKSAAGCVMKAMKVGETVALGVSDTTVVTRADRAKVVEFAVRPKAVACLAALPSDSAA